MEASVFYDKWLSLSPANQKQASDFLDFLLFRQRMDTSTQESKIQLGVWRDMPFYISDDFDEPLEDFREYM